MQGCQRDVNRANAAAATPVDFTPVWQECDALRNRLLDVEDASMKHKQQLELALEELAAESAANDVLGNLDFAAIEDMVRFAPIRILPHSLLCPNNTRCHGAFRLTSRPILPYNSVPHQHTLSTRHC